MHSDAWQRLFGLENRDAVCRWFPTLHGRELSSRRALEITSAAKQAREFFRNSANSNDSVRPLLTFYGVAALSRAVVLLLRRSGGEETLVGSHGLETVGWSGVLSSDIAASLRTLDSIKLRSTQGLFTDFLKETDNRICMHVRSSGVDWRLSYPQPALGGELTLGDLLSRLPDLAEEFERLNRPMECAVVNTMSFSQEAGFSAKVRAGPFERFRKDYESHGYFCTQADGWTDLNCNAATFETFVPQFSHSYLAKTFGSIPCLYIGRSFAADVRYSQLALTYQLSYTLGMLARYYPTHWTALLGGAKGDELWPSIRLTQEYVETAFPELVAEFIDDALRQSKRAGTNADAAQDSTA
jgi:hypothetical protein